MPAFPGAGLDASDRDGGGSVQTWPVQGLYMPDAIASYQVNGLTYLITANEGDARADWPGFNEETRVRSHCSALDAAVPPGQPGAQVAVDAGFSDQPHLTRVFRSSCGLTPGFFKKLLKS